MTQTVLRLGKRWDTDGWKVTGPHELQKERRQRWEYQQRAEWKGACNHRTIACSVEETEQHIILSTMPERETFNGSELGSQKWNATTLDSSGEMGHSLLLWQTSNRWESALFAVYCLLKVVVSLEEVVGVSECSIKHCCVACLYKAHVYAPLLVWWEGLKDREERRDICKRRAVFSNSGVLLLFSRKLPTPAWRYMAN